MKMEGTKIVYEVGDWVMPTESVDWNRNNSFPCKIREINGDCADCNDVSNSCYVGNLRPATQDEINKATEEEKIMWGEYEVKFLRRDSTDVMGNIKIGCVIVSKELWDKTAEEAGWS